MNKNYGLLLLIVVAIVGLNGVVYGQPSNSMELSQDRPGGDYRSFDLSNNPAQCRDKCASEGQCRAWTFAKPGIVGPSAKCFLKSEVPNPRPNDCCVSGVKTLESARPTTPSAPSIPSAPAASSNGALERGTDRPGGDYRSFDLSNNPAQCRDKCASEGQCRAWTFAKPGIVGPSAKCFLKSEVPNPRPNECCVSGVKTLENARPSTPSAPSIPSTPASSGSGALERGIDRPGGDYRSFDLSNNPAQCRDKCASEGQCRAWTFAKPGIVGPSAKCFLKSEVPNPRPNECCVSGVKTLENARPSASSAPSAPASSGSGALERGTDRPGGDYRSFDLSNNPAQCRDKCASEGQCRAWTFAKPGIVGPSAKCFLKSEVPNPRPNECCVSGVKSLENARPSTPSAPSIPSAPAASSSGALERGTDRPGGDYRSFDLSNNPAQCRDKCASEGQCRAWTFAKPGIVGPSAKCFLKSEVPNPRPNECCVSGVKQVNNSRPSYQIDGSSAAVDSGGFHMIFMGDPQLPWSEIDEATGERGETGPELLIASAERNVIYATSINKRVSDLGIDNVKGLVINGDLTAWGASSQLSTFKDIYSSISVPLYLGLGNHDYQRPDEEGGSGCDAHDCSRMVEFMVDHIEERQYPNRDINIATGYSFPSNFRTISGSLAYSWDIDNIHFVQLQNFPSYTQTWGAYHAGDARTNNVEIRSSMTWLEQDLANAYAAGKSIILNYHDPREHWKDHDNIKDQFLDLLTRYDVTAVFVGHYHELLGLGGPGVTEEFGVVDYGSVKVLFSGAPTYRRYLSVHFKDSKMTVSEILLEDDDIARERQSYDIELKVPSSKGAWVSATGPVSDPNYFGPLEDQYAHIQTLKCSGASKVSGFALFKLGNRLAPKIDCERNVVTASSAQSGQLGRHPWVSSSWGSNYFGSLEDQYADTRQLDCPEGKFIQAFEFFKRGNRLAPRIKCEGSNSWIQATGPVNDALYFGPLEDQYADNKAIKCPSHQYASKFRFFKRGNRLAPAIYCE